MSDLLAGLRSMVSRRAELAAEIARIDQELGDLRALLSGESVGMPAVAAPPQTVTASTTLYRCQRCQKMFTPSPGVSGKFCSRDCFAGGISVEDRRAALLEALQGGPEFPSTIAQLPAYAHLSRGTVTNDLYALSKQGRVVNTQDGWALAQEGGEASGIDDDDEPPLVPPATVCLT